MAIDFVPDPELYPFESRWHETRVGRVHYVDEGRGRPILFLHGNPTWSFLYRDIVKSLRGRFRCVAVDYPGFGLSDRPAAYGYTPAEHSMVIRELVEALDLTDLIVMGQDWGGPIGLAVAVDVPDRVTGLVFGNTWFWPVDRWATRLFGLGMSSPPMRWAVRHRNAFVEWLIPMGTARSLSEREMEHYRAVQPDPASRAGVAEFPRQLRKSARWLDALSHRVPRVLGDRPLLLTWGMRDFAFPPHACLPRWEVAFADVEVVRLERAKHFIQEDAPEAIAHSIDRRFGARIRRGSPPDG